MNSIPLDQLEAAIRAVESDDLFVQVPLEVEGKPVQFLARPGYRYWFEYHCYEGHDSGDAEVWYHSHQQCEVLGFADCAPCSGATPEDRGEYCIPLVYRVRFDDGLVWDVWEDELLSSPDEFYRPDPPSGGSLKSKRTKEKQDV